MRAKHATCAGLVLLLAPRAVAEPQNLYEWIAVAPILASGESLGHDGKWTELRIDRVLRGDLPPGQVVRIDVRLANRERSRNSDPGTLRLDAGTRYLVLLEPLAGAKQGPRPCFLLARGVRGARELPPEGADALLSAIARLVRVQEQKDDRATWRQLAEFLDETDPILIETALDQFLKFRRGDPGLLTSLVPLLSHPSHLLRERTARLIGQVLAGTEDGGIPEVATVQSELVARARRDPAVVVRIAATGALDGLKGASVDEILREIANDDPDQTVRYAAETLIHDRRKRRSPGGSDTPGGLDGRR